MSNLAPQKINLSYSGLLQVPGGLTSSLQYITDGNGVSSGLQISTTGFSGTIVSDTVTITGGTINGTAIGATNPSSGRFSSLTVSALTGLLKGSSGAVSTATANTDYLTPPSGTAILKANSGGALANATSGVDYAPATSGSSVLSGNGSGGFTNVSIGPGLTFVGSTISTTTGLDNTKLLASNGLNGFTAVTVGSGLQYSGGTLSSVSGGGSVTTVSVVSANGFTGTVANASSTPAITLATSITGLLKGNGTAISAASAGTDYAPATSGTALLKGNGAGGFSSAAAGSDYLAPPSGTSILKANSGGALANAVAGTDYPGLSTTNTFTANQTISGNLTASALIPSSSTIPTNGLFLPTTNTLAWSTNSTERLRLDSSGNLGLGVTPSAWNGMVPAFEIGGYGSAVASWGSNRNLYLLSNAYYGAGGFTYKTTGGAAYYNLSGETNSHKFYVAPSGTAGNAISFTQAMTLDASGLLSVGRTSAWDSNAVLTLEKSGVAAQVINSTTNTVTLINVANGNSAFAYTGTASNHPFAFYTNGSERARIDSSGNLLVGTTTAPTTGKMNIVNGLQMTGASTGTAIASNNGSAEVAYLTLGAVFNVAGSYDVALGISNIATTAGKRIYVQNRTAGVYLADGGTSWTSNSDERLKTNLKPIENAAQKVSTLRAVTGRYKTDEEGVSRSFLIAQDVQAVLPEAVDASDPDKLGVAYTDTIPLLVAAIKELSAELNELKQKVNA